MTIVADACRRRDALRACLGLTTAATCRCAAGVAGRRRGERRGQDRPRGRAEHLRSASDRWAQHPDLHRQRVRRPDGARRPGQPDAGPGRVLEAHERRRTWQFTLRQGVKFHNGDDFNAEAVKFTLDRATNPETKATISSELGTIAGDRDRGPVHRERGDQDARLPAAGASGRAVRPDAFAQAHAPPQARKRIATKPNGTGPFKLVTWTKNERLVLEANESYWRGAPQVKTLIVRPILEDAARIAALQTGEVDLIAPVPHVRIAELQRNDKLVIKTIAAPRIFHVTIDVRKPPFDNVKVRQALNYAVDVNAIIKTLYFGHGTRLATVVDKGALGLRPERAAVPVRPEQRPRRCWPRPASRTASRSSSTASPAASRIIPSRPRRSSATCRRSASRPSSTSSSSPPSARAGCRTRPRRCSSTASATPISSPPG